MTGKAIYGILNAAAPVTGYVSTRIYPDMAPQNAEYPFIVYRLTGNLPSDTKEGASILDVVEATVEMYSKTYTQAQDIAGAVRTALDRYSGTVSGVEIDSIRFAAAASMPMVFDEHIYIVEHTYNIREKR
jgi:hypothetical protein